MKEEQKIQTKNTAGFMDSNVKHLYDAMISQGYTGLGDFSNFEGKMKDSGKRRMVYDYLIQDDYFSEIGDFSKFESALGYSPAERKDYVSQSSVNPAPIALRQEVDVPMKDQSEYVNPWTNSPDYNFESLRKKGKIETATPPPPTEYEKDSSFMNTWAGDAIQKLNAGGADLGAGIFGVLDKAAKGLESATGGLIPRGGAFKDISDRFKADAEFSRARSNRYNGKDFTDLWKEGNYMGAIGDIALQGVESLPMSIGAMAATMAGAPAAGLAGIGSIVASQKYDDLDQNNPNMGEFAKVSNAILTGTAESLSEMLGAGVSKAWMSTLFKTLGKEKAQEAIKRGIMGKMQEFYKKFGMFFEPVNEGIEEVSSTLAENITDKITGADPERDLTDGVLQSFVYGMGGGAYFTGAGALAKGAQYVADKIGGKQAQQPITDSNVTDQGVETPPLLTKSRFAEAEEEGRNMTDPGDIRTASKKMEETRLSLSGMVPGLASTIESYVDDKASEAQVMSLLDGVNADARPLAEDFYADYLRISGLQDRIGEEIDNEVETYVANNITPYVTTNPDGQSIVTTATLSEGNEERPVYVRSIEGDKAVISDNGQDRMVSVKRLSDIVEQDAGHMRRTYEDQLLATRQSELDMTMHHNPKTQLPKPGLIIWNGDNAFILQGQDENGDWIAQPAAYDRETGQVTAKNGSSPAMPITENEILDLQDAIYDAQQVNVVSPENDNVASADAKITSAPPVEDAINQPTSEIETEGAIDQIAQPSNVENPSMVMREDGTPDFVSSGTDMTLDFLHDKYGDKMPRKIEVTRKSFDESLKKASDALEKAQEAYDDAPIGKEDKAEAALIKARQEYEAIKVEADFWANLDDDIKEASKKPGDVIAKEISVIGDPMSGEELAAMMLANGAIKLTRDSYKKETGAGNNETARMFGLFASPEKGGVNIERAGEILELADRENGTNFFDENDTNAGRDAIIEVLSSARTRGDLIDYVKRNREAIAERERQAEYNAYAEWCEENYHMSPEEYEAYEESMARDFSEKQLTDEERGELDSQIVDEIQAIIDEQNEIDAILAQNKPIENENIEGNDESGGDGLREGGGEVLPREQLDQTGGTGEVEGRESAGPDIDRTDGATQEGSSRGLVPFVAPSPKENETPLDYAERIVEAKRLFDEELKVNTNPSEAQKEAGNYKKGHVKINGFDVSIEQPVGSVRSGKDASGKEWSQVMNNTYGYIRGTESVDGDHIDVFLGPDMNSDMVYVVDQVNTDGSFDEHKVMMGFSSLEDARSAYLSNYEEGWQGLGNITGVALDEFKKWIDSSIRKTKPFSEYKSVVPVSPLTVSRSDKSNEYPLLDIAVDPIVWMKNNPGKTPTSKDLFPAGKADEYLGTIIDEQVVTTDKGITLKYTKYNNGYSITAEKEGGYIKQSYYNNGLPMTSPKFNIGVNDSSFKQYIKKSKDGTLYIDNKDIIPLFVEDVSRKVKKLSLVDKDDYITSAERKHIKAFLESGLKEARVNNSIYEISNIGDDGVYEIVRRFNYTDPLTLVKDENGKLVNKRGEGEHVIRVKPTFEETRPDSGIRFRETRIIPEEENIIKKAKSDGSYMKAPNGNPTNLNEKQWVQVRTKAFKEWFGDWENNPEDASKVIDENGEPRVVYHGTYANFNAFDESHLGDVTDLNATNEDWVKTSHIGFWFNDNKIGFYTKHKPVFLNVRNPLEFASMESLVDEMSYYDSGEDFKRSNSDGYDSVIVLEDEEMGGRSYSVFNDNQIKSATENNGGFSSHNDDIRFREVKDKNGEKSLVGLHNISEEKLRKALRQGGFANPSAAVIDISRQSHTGYGSISLVLPSSMIEKRTGKNAGTWSQDAWTPIYPTIERQFSGKGSDAFSKDLQKLPEEMRSTTKSGMDSYMDGRGEDSLAYMYLYEQGKAPELARTKPSYPEKTRTEVEDATNGSFSMSGLSDKQLSRLKDAYMEYKGFSTEGYNEAIKLRRAKLEEAIGKMNPRSILYEKRKTDLERIDKYGFDYSAVESFMKSVRDDISNSDKVDAHGTMRDSWNFIEENGMRGDFNKWLDKLNERYGIKEIIFNGFTPSGIRKYIPNTLENVSKFMKKQGRSASVGIGASFQNFAASLLDAKGSLKDIRKDKGKLTTDHADVDAFRDKWSKVFHELGEKLQPDAKGYDDYGLYRLAEAARSKDPQKYIKEEYGIDFSDEDVKTLNEMVDAIRNEYPAMYFETKFERPVYLEEFAAAVVPDNVDGDIRKAIYDAGLKIFTYKADDEISRNEAVKQASEIDGVRFRFIGEKGAANLDRVEEATTRLDNLAIAREMESSGKEAKAIKMATGWERGADKKWRYEVGDFEVDIEGLARKNRLYENLPWGKEYDALSDKLFDGVELTDEESDRFDELLGMATELSDSYKESDVRYLDDYVKDDSLFKEYPELKQVRVEMYDDPASNTGATWFSERNLIRVNESSLERMGIRNILVHEVQHAIQSIEGFAQGGSMEYAQEKLLDYYLQDYTSVQLHELANLRRSAEKLVESGQYKRIPYAVKHVIKESKEQGFYPMWADNFDNRDDAVITVYDTLVGFTSAKLDEASYFDKRKAYLSIAGEVESRNATYRMDMTPEERRNSLASETEDVAREDQIFLDNSLSDNMSLDNIIDRSINDWSNKLNTPVRVIHDVNDITDTNENMLARKRDSKGWYDTSTGEIVIVSPNSTSVGDAQRTFLHEVVGHYGLRELFGDDFDTFLDNVYRNANEDIRKNIIDRTKGNPLNLREATEEYIAELAERGFDNKAERSLWEKIKDAFLDMLRKAGISLDFKLSDNDLRYILWRSYKNLEQGNLMDVAEDTVMRNRLGLNNINLNENGSIERDIEPEKGKQSSETKGTGRELETIEGVNENGNESERDHIDKPRGVENAIDGTENATDRNGRETDGQVDNDGDQLDGGDTGDRNGSVRDGIDGEWTVIGRAGSENKGRGVGESVREKTDDFAFAERIKKENDNIRFREAKSEVENEEPLNKEMVDAWDKVASSDSFKFKEAMVDSLTAIDEFLKLLAKKTKSKILDYENPYYALIALSSKNKADMDSFDSKFLNPLNEAIRALIGDASEVSKKGLRRTWDWSKGPLRDLVKYVQSKHGIERNRDMSVRDGIETLKAFDVDALSKMGVISDSDLKNAKKTAEKVAEEKGSEAYKKTYDKVLGKELKKGVDKGKAERSAEIAADYRKSFVKSEIYNKEMDKYKEKVTGTLIDRWEDSKKDVLNKDLAWDEEQKELDREALSFQWKLGDNSYGVILGKDYSGLSSVFKSSEDGANKDKWLSDAYDFVRDYESTHNMVLVDNLWDKVHNVSEYTLRRQYESGLISKSYMDKNLSRFKYFIPLRGFSDNIASDVYDYIDATEIKMGNPVKTAKGRISEADNPFAGLIHVGYGSITAGNRNLAKQRFLNLASNHDTGGLITIDNIWVRNVGTEENPEWVESIPQIPDNASGEEVAKAVKDHEEMMRELREEGKAELIKGGRSDIPYKTLYDQRSQHQVQVFVGGNRYVMTVNGNPRLAQAVNGLTNPDVKDDLAYVVARNLKTFMAGAFTSKNVAFSFANLIRDTPYANNSVFVTENFRYFKDFSGNQRRALFGLRSLGRNLYKYRRGEIDIADKEQAIFKEFMDNGGATGYTFVETQKEYAKDLANKLEKLSDGNIGKLSPKELVSTVFECFEFMGNVAELVNRYAAYKTSREHGRSIDRSINDAKEVSVNFNKKGAGKKTKSDKWYINTAAWISEYGRDWVLFFNAAVQSMYKEYSMMRNHPIKGIGSRIAPLIFMGSSVSLLNNLFMPMLFAYLGWDSDDDDRDYFDSLSDHERQNNICIRLTHGRWLKIPLSPELANYFKIGDIIAGQLSGKREVEAMDVVKTGIDMVSPLNINWEYDSWKFALNLLPTVVQPIAQNASNVNFMGNPIYKTSMNKANDYDPEYTKVYRSTSTTMVELSRALNSLTGGDDVKRGTSFNPATWQNILSGYTGGFGTVALGVSDLVLDMLSGENGDMPVSRYPLLSRFLTGGDKDLKLSRMNSIYNKKVVDFVSEMDHDYKGYLKKIQDTSVDDFDRAGYMVKLNQLTGSDDYRRSMVLSQYVKAISDMERFLREVGSDNDSLENQLYELKLQALEIFEDSDE